MCLGPISQTALFVLLLGFSPFPFTPSLPTGGRRDGHQVSAVNDNISAFSGFLTMWNVITVFTSLWFMITKGMLAPLWANPHKPHICAHPLTVHAHFKGWTNYNLPPPPVVNNPSVKHHAIPSHTGHSFSQWHRVLCSLMLYLHPAQAGLSAHWAAEVPQLRICPAPICYCCQYV